jgi:hypothetical protein
MLHVFARYAGTAVSILLACIALAVAWFIAGGA